MLQKYADVGFLLNEQHEDLVDKGIAMLDYLIDCVRDGNPDNVQYGFLDPDIRRLQEEFIGDDYDLAEQIFSFTAPQILRSALTGGFPYIPASNLYFQYANEVDVQKTADDVWAIFYLMVVDFADQVRRTKEDRNYSPLVRRCRAYVRDHLYKPLTVKSIAERFHVSASYLSSVFKEETHQTVREFIRQEKMEEAKRLLQDSSIPIAEVGQRLGYCSQSHFTDVFRRFVRMTPREFRENGSKIIVENLTGRKE